MEEEGTHGRNTPPTRLPPSMPSLGNHALVATMHYHLRFPKQTTMREIERDFFFIVAMGCHLVFM